MANILDYIEWRGDLPIKDVPLSEADALVFSRAAYMPLEGRIMSFVNELSPFEKKTFSLYISGMKYSSMAEKLGCSVKSVDNAITRIKSKIKKFKAR